MVDKAMPHRIANARMLRAPLAAMAARLGAGLFILLVVAGSAVMAKEAKYVPPLAAWRVEGERARVQIEQPVETAAAEPEVQIESLPILFPTETRWFNGRPVRPARTLRMTVTAYSPDERSCGDSADGITATLHHVETNAHELVAADPSVLPYGSLVTVPGYGRDEIVPVLDCGSAIKGRRLDVLFPAHRQAVRWGVRKLEVTVWEYADGKPADNPRRLREFRPAGRLAASSR